MSATSKAPVLISWPDMMLQQERAWLGLGER